MPKLHTQLHMHARACGSMHLRYVPCGLSIPVRERPILPDLRRSVCDALQIVASLAASGCCLCRWRLMLSASLPTTLRPPRPHPALTPLSRRAAPTTRCRAVSSSNPQDLHGHWDLQEAVCRQGRPIRLGDRTTYTSGDRTWEMPSLGPTPTEDTVKVRAPPGTSQRVARACEGQGRRYIGGDEPLRTYPLRFISYPVV